MDPQKKRQKAKRRVRKAKKTVFSAPRIELGTFRLQILQLQSNVINQLHQAEMFLRTRV
jgi:hypothetical protein